MAFKSVHGTIAVDSRSIGVELSGIANSQLRNKLISA